MMNRRNLIKTLGISAVGLATVPLWIEAWTEEDLPSTDSEMNESQKIILAELVETIIPSTDTPGAKELKLGQFVETMITDCYEKEVQESFYDGIRAIEESSKEQFNRSFSEIPKEEKMRLLESLASAPKPDDSDFSFVPFVKNLTVAGFMTSKYYMENILHYELVPARFHGSFPISQTIYKNS